MDPRIHFRGGASEAKLQPAQREKLNALAKSCPEMLSLHVYPNLDTTSEENIPSGIAMYFPLTAKVDPTIVSDSLFQTFCVSRVRASPHGKELDDEHFIKGAAALNEAVKQYPEVRVTGDTRHPMTNKEKHQWSPELGGESAFIGAYYQLDTHRDKTYYLISRGTVPLVVRDFKTLIAEREPTYGQLFQDNDWRAIRKHAAYVAHRNVQRNLANVAEAYQVSIVRTDDIGGKLDEPHHSYRERACPEYTLDGYTIRQATYNQKPVAVLYNGVVPKEDLYMLPEHKFFITANPNDGIYVARLANRTDLTAVPIDTGRNDGTQEVQKKKPTSSALKIKQHAINTGIVWENAHVLKEHPDLVPGAFRPLGQEMKATLRQAGWHPEDHIGVLVCLAAKIYSPALKAK
jgi:hypothetical protein